MNEKMKKAFGANSFKYGTYSLMISAIVIAIVIAVNIYVGTLPIALVNIDISHEGLYSIGEVTENIVKDLNDDVTIYLVGDEDNMDEGLVQTTERYADLSKHIEVKTVDPDKNPAFLSQYEIKFEELTGNGVDILVASDKRNKLITRNELYPYTYGESAMLMYQLSGDAIYLSRDYDAEAQITGAIDYVTTQRLPKLYVLTGHDETELDGTVLELLNKNNISVETLDLNSQASVPEDCDILMIYRPAKDFSDDELTAIVEYITYGGKSVIFNYPEMQADMPNYNKFLKYYGVTIPAKGFLFEGTAYSYRGIRYYLYEPLGDNSFTESLDSKHCFTTYAQPIIQLEDMRKTLKIEPILSTSDSSWYRTNLQSQLMDEKIESDTDGPYDYAVSIIDSTNEGQGQIALFSSFDFLQLEQLNKAVPGNANSDVFINVLSTMGSLSSNLSIERKTSGTLTNTVSTGTAYLGRIIFIVVVPVVVIIIGFVVWATRRRR